jgi:hypothetical protein
MQDLLPFIQELKQTRITIPPVVGLEQSLQHTLSTLCLSPIERSSSSLTDISWEQPPERLREKIEEMLRLLQKMDSNSQIKLVEAINCQLDRALH